MTTFDTTVVTAVSGNWTVSVGPDPRTGVTYVTASSNGGGLTPLGFQVAQTLMEEYAAGQPVNYYMTNSPGQSVLNGGLIQYAVNTADNATQGDAVVALLETPVYS